MNVPQELTELIKEKRTISKWTHTRWYDLPRNAEAVFVKSQQWGLLLWDEKSIELAIRQHRLDTVKWLAQEKPLLFKARVPENAIAINSRWEMIDFLLKAHPKLLNEWSAGKCMENIAKHRDLQSFQRMFPIILEKYPDIIELFVMRQVANWGAGWIAKWLVENYYDLTTPAVRGIVEFMREIET